MPVKRYCIHFAAIIPWFPAPCNTGPPVKACDFTQAAGLNGLCPAGSIERRNHCRKDLFSKILHNGIKCARLHRLTPVEKQLLLSGRRFPYGVFSGGAGAFMRRTSADIRCHVRVRPAAACASRRRCATARGREGPAGTRHRPWRSRVPAVPDRRPPPVRRRRRRR